MNNYANLWKKNLPLSLAVLTLMAIAACGGSDDSSSDPTATAVPTATTVVQEPTATPVPTATPAPTATTAPTPTVEPTATEAAASSGDAVFDDPTGQFDQELLAQGKVLFDETAGSVGCAFCHGLDGKGNGPAGIGAPPNRGLDSRAFNAALTEGESGAMEFLQGQLSSSEKKAVVEYLGWLGTQP